MRRPLGSIGALTDAGRAVDRAEARVVRAASAHVRKCGGPESYQRLREAVWELRRARKERAAAKRALRKRIRASKKAVAK